MTGDGLDGELSRQGRNALDETTPQALARDTRGATNASPGNPLYPQAFDQAPLCIRDAVWRATRAILASPSVAGMMLLAMVPGAVGLIPGRLIPRAHIAAKPGWLLTASPQEAGWVSSSTAAFDQPYMEYTTPDSSSRLYEFNLNLRFGHEGVTAEDRDRNNFGAPL